MGRFAEWLRVPARPERLALLRILVAGYGVSWLMVRAPHFVDVAAFGGTRWRPVGVLAGLDAPPSGRLVATVVIVAVLSGVAVVAGWKHRITGPTFAITLLLVTTWRNCWGQIFHTEHLLVLHAMLLAVVPAAVAWSLDARAVRARSDPPGGTPASFGPFEPSGRFGWPVRVLALLTVSTYVVAGVAKLRYGGLDWLDGDVLAHQIAFDNVRKAAVGSPASPIAGALLEHRWLFTPMALGTLLVELGAPLALISRWAARLWVAAAWLFHLGIVVTMVIAFAYPLSLVALAPVLLAHGEDVPLRGLGRRLAARVGLVRDTGSSRSVTAPTLEP